MNTESFFVLTYILINMISNGYALKCWKCIAHDCELEPAKNIKSSEVTCDDGQKCMKVRYRMYDNITHYDSVIRTCTAGPCLATTPDEFQKCLSTPKLYMISGCTLRTCCSDRDLCNGAVNTSSHCVLIVVTLLLTIFVRCLSMGGFT